MSKEKKENQNEKKGYLISELISVNDILLRCKNDKEVKNSSTILSSIRISRQIQKHLNEFKEEREEIFKKFNVELKSDDQNRQFYDYSKHKDKELIENALKECFNTKYQIDGFNTIEENDFIYYTRGLTQDEMTFLYDFLVKEE